MSKIILCVDMDAFFASVEQQVNPVLQDKPITVTVECVGVWIATCDR